MPDKPNLLQCCENGYWFCWHCDRVVLLSTTLDSPATCPRCGYKTAEWQPPVDFTEKNN